jgi:hypothetical protein
MDEQTLGLIKELERKIDYLLKLENHRFSALESDGDIKTDGGLVIGSLSYDPPANNIVILNPDNEAATATLRFSSDIPNLRYGGSGAGSAAGFEIQGTSDTVKLKINDGGDALIPGGAYIGAIDTDPSTGTLVIENNSALTNSTAQVLFLRHNTSGTPSAGFGAQIHFQLESSTNENRDAASIVALWDTTTDASRRGALVFYPRDASAAREALKLGTNGSLATVAFYGVTPTTRQNVTGSKAGNAALANLINALATLGLITDGTT